MQQSTKVSDIANFFAYEYNGDDLLISRAVSISALSDEAFSFVNKKTYKIDHSKRALVIAMNGYAVEEGSKCTFIFSSNPRLDFIKIVDQFFTPKKEPNISKNIKIGKNCTFGKNISISDYCVIKDNVTIGDNTIINNHVVIESNTTIGENCYIKSGAIIGEDGFGFERDENGVPLRFPHIGNVVIGNNVEIGAKTTIARGTLESTVLKDNVKVDDQVFIAHNVVIEENTMIVSCSEISGSTKIGKNCWIGPNCTIKDGLIIGDNVFLGIACSISKNIEANTKYGTITDLGLRDIVKFNKLIKS